MKDIIVVEGKSDTNRLKLIDPKIQTFETSGLGLDEEKMEKLKKLSEKYRLIIFTDPDGPGEIIRNRIVGEIENVYHAYLPNNKAISKNKLKVGVEHASLEEIKKALKNLHYQNKEVGNYTLSNLIDWKIYNNKEKRKKFCDSLNLAYGNNQKVLKQLNYFNIDINKINEVIEKL